MFSPCRWRGAIRTRVQLVALSVGLIGCIGAAVPACAEPPVLKSEWYDPSRPEIRVGGFASVWGPEYGKADVNVAFVLPRPVFDLPQGMPDYAVPRIQIGGMGNVSHGTSFVHGDFIWTLNVTSRWFFEHYVGVAFHNGQIDGPSPSLASLGCHTLIHSGINFGYRVDQHWTIMAVFDHVSNAKSLSGCITNQGLNLSGVRVGYAF